MLIMGKNYYIKSLLTTLLVTYSSQSLAAKATEVNALWQCRIDEETGSWSCFEQKRQDINVIVPVTQRYATSEALIDIFNWRTTSSEINICRGYYYDEPFRELADKQVDLDYDVAFLPQGNNWTFSGSVNLSDQNRQLSTDLAYVTINPDTNQHQYIDAYGNVVLREPGYLVVADSGRYHLDNSTWRLKDTLFRLPLSQSQTPNLASSKFARGSAQIIERNKPGVTEFYGPLYTSCSPNSNTWSLRGSKLTLDHNEGRGYVKNAVLFVKKVPIFYFPYYSFPIDDRRKSGFLDPVIGNSSNHGYFANIPYYLNLAPDYDATITPTYYQKRGYQLDGQFRYLTSTSTGYLSGSFLPDDKAFKEFKQTTAYPPSSRLNDLRNASDSRKAFSFYNLTRINPNISSALTYNHVSDDYFTQDFTQTFAGSVTERQLLQSANVKYQNYNWNAGAVVQQYQTLQPLTLNTVETPYKLLPQLYANGNFPDQAMGLMFNIDTQFTYFDHKLASKDTGGRTNLAATASRPFTSSWGYFTPAIKVNTTNYQLNRATANNGLNKTINRTIPTFSLDSGLYFDKETSLFGSSYQQTLEPRLFYLYVPFKDQNDIPNFDAAFPRFTYNTLFRTNRFTGLDRIGDANQLAYSVTTRFLQNDTGLEKLTFNLGQIYYFRDRDVTIVSNPNDRLSENPNANQAFSPLAAQLRYAINHNWYTNANLQWNFAKNKADGGNVELQYKSGDERIFSVSYTFVSENREVFDNNDTTSEEWNIKQINAYTAWPLFSSNNWFGLAGARYSGNLNNAREYMLGLTYESCCWALRLVGERALRGTTTQELTRNVYDNRYYLQWSLKGLATIGNRDPNNLIAERMLNYNDKFGLR